MSDAPSRSHGRKSIAATLAPRELMTDRPDLAGVWRAQVVTLFPETFPEGLVFLLWGGYAKKKAALIDQSKHHILTSGHPSPLSANRGLWFGNKHFSKTNEILVRNGQEPIKW